MGSCRKTQPVRNKKEAAQLGSLFLFVNSLLDRQRGAMGCCAVAQTNGVNAFGQTIK
jgi:hypothetical protein